MAKELRAGIFKVIEQHGISSAEYRATRRHFQNEMNRLISAGKTKDGIAYCEVYTELIERQGNNSNTFNAKNTLGMAYVKEGMLQQAKELFETLKKAMEQNGWAEAEKLASVIYNLALTEYYLKNEQTAKELFQECVRRLEKQEAAMELKIVARADLARLFFREGNLAEALRLYREVYPLIKSEIDASEQQKKKSGSAILFLEIANIECLHNDRHRAAHALKDARSCIEIDTQNALAIIKFIELGIKAGIVDEVEDFVNECVPKLPPDFSLELKVKFIRVYLTKRESEKGEAVCRDILAVDNTAPLELDRKMRVCRALASFCNAQGKSAEALAHLATALEIARRMSKASSASVEEVDILEEIGVTHLRGGSLSESEEAFLCILNLLETQRYPAAGKWKGNALEKLLSIKLMQRDREATLAYALLAHQEFGQPKYNSSLNVRIRLKHTIFLAYSNLDRHEEAEKWLVDYRQAVEQHSNKNDMIYAEFLERVGALEEKAAQFQRAESSYERSAKILESLTEEYPELAGYAQKVRRYAEEVRQKARR